MGKHNNELMSYLTNINDQSELKYIFSKAKLGGGDDAIDKAQKGMQTFFKDNAEELFKPVSNGGLGTTKMKQLFKTNGIPVNNPAQFKAAMNNQLF